MGGRREEKGRKQKIATTKTTTTRGTSSSSRQTKPYSWSVCCIAKRVRARSFKVGPLPLLAIQSHEPTSQRYRLESSIWALLNLRIDEASSATLDPRPLESNPNHHDPHFAHIKKQRFPYQSEGVPIPPPSVQCKVRLSQRLLSPRVLALGV